MKVYGKLITIKIPLFFKVNKKNRKLKKILFFSQMKAV